MRSGFSYWWVNNSVHSFGKLLFPLLTIKKVTSETAILVPSNGSDKIEKK